MSEHTTEAKRTIRELTLNEVKAVSGGDGPVMNPPPPIIDIRPSPNPS